MKITIIGSTSYLPKMLVHKEKLEAEGNEVFIPAFDYHPEFDEFDVCRHNKELISVSDELHVFWDRRSTGTIFDLGMAFALSKPVRVIYLNSKTFEGLMQKMEEREGLYV